MFAISFCRTHFLVYTFKFVIVFQPFKTYEINPVYS